jgi:hypothetical protein
LLAQAGRKEELAGLRSVTRDVLAAGDHGSMLNYLHRFAGPYVGRDINVPATQALAIISEPTL